MWCAGLAALLFASGARGQDASQAAPAAPALRGLSPEEFAALQPLAARGAAILVRDADRGAQARITVLVRARASVDVVRGVVTSPEHYTEFMPTLSSVDIVSRRGARVAFRFHVNAVIFDVTTLSALHVVNPNRVDVSIIQSDIGPGASRWDLQPDGDGTLIALTTWGDPSQGNWFLRQVASRSPSAIAGMNISADTILALGLARRAEIVAGAHLPARPSERFAPPGPLAPPARGPWMALTHDVAVGSIALNDQGVFTQSTVAIWSHDTPASLRHSLEAVEQYRDLWPSIHQLEVLSRDVHGVVVRTSIDSSMSHVQGEERVQTEPDGDAQVVWWRGVAGDYVGQDHRWDLVPDPSGGTVVMLTGGAEYNRTSALTRGLVDRDVWLMPGFATSWKLVWMRPLVGSSHH